MTSQRSKFEFAPGQPSGPDNHGLDPLTHGRLWGNPCWLSARLNILANWYNMPIYGWIEKRFGLSRPEFVVLYSIGLVHETTASAISASTGFPKNTLSRAVNRLLKLKLVKRADDPDDKRLVRLQFTSTGKRIVDEAMPELYAHERRMMTALDAQEREKLSILLAKMITALEAESNPSE